MFRHGSFVQATAAVLLLGACAVSVRTNPGVVDRPVRVAQTFDHGVFDSLLHKYVDAEGLVDYRALVGEKAVLVAYLDSLGLVDPSQLATRAEREAYWLNAYNATALFGVLRYGPHSGDDDTVDFGSLVSTRCGGMWWTLDEIEQRGLRPLHDPRVYLALCDGSRGSGRLRPEAYTGAKVDAQLDAAARAFLADPHRNQLDDARRVVRLSPVFDRHAQEFAVPPYLGVRGFVRAYAPPREWLQGEFACEEAGFDRRLNARTTEQ
jgi:Protein of unknown function, DUF547